MKRFYKNTLLVIAMVTLGFQSSLSYAVVNKNDKSVHEKEMLIKDKNSNKRESNNKDTQKKNIFLSRRAKIEKNMENNSMLILFSGMNNSKADGNLYPFCVDRNFYYLTGLEEANMGIIITKTDNIVKEYLIKNKRTPECELWLGELMDAEKCKEISGVKFVAEIQNIEYVLLQNDVKELMKVDNLESMFNDKKISTLYVNCSGDDKFDFSLDKSFAENIKSVYPYVEVSSDCLRSTMDLRTIKDNEEIKNIRKAIDITESAIKNSMANVKPGMTENQLEAYFDFVLKSNNVRELSFDSIIGAGKNGTIIHYSKNNGRINKGDLVLMDVGAKYNNYAADITRTFPANGKFTNRQKEVYNAVLKAQLETIKAIKPGVRFNDLDNVALDVLSQECKKLGLIQNKEEIYNYYMHSVTHSLGLECHDPYINNVLKEGMVITAEPGLYVGNENIGIRIEDDVVVTKNGCEVLSKGIPKTVKEIEKFMAKNKAK